MKASTGSAELRTSSSGRFSAARNVFKSLAGDKVALVSAIFLVLLLAVAIVPSIFASHDPYDQDLRGRLQAPLTDGHLLGTDSLGRDLYSRMIYGTRLTLVVGLGSVGVAMAIGVTLGIAAGYYGGWFDSIVMRLADIQMAFSSLLLILVVVVMIGPGVDTLIIVFGLGTWVVHARVVRGSVLAIREMQFIEAARATGTSTPAILFRHILPNLIPVITSVAVLEAARLMIAEASLSFLGYGVQPPSMTWGLLIAQGEDYLANSWWVGTLPGIAIILTVLSMSMFGLWVRARYDPFERTILADDEDETEFTPIPRMAL